MRAGVVAFVRSELPQQMNRPTRVAFRQRECSRKVSLASQVNRLNKVRLASQVNRLDNVNCRNKRAISSNGRSCKVSLASQVDRLNKVSFASHVYRLDNGSRRNTETVNGNNRTTDLYPQSVLPSAVSVVLVDPVPPSGKR